MWTAPHQTILPAPCLGFDATGFYHSLFLVYFFFLWRLKPARLFKQVFPCLCLSLMPWCLADERHYQSAKPAKILTSVDNLLKASMHTVFLSPPSSSIHIWRKKTIFHSHIGWQWNPQLISVSLYSCETAQHIWDEFRSMLAMTHCCSALINNPQTPRASWVALPDSERRPNGRGPGTAWIRWIWATPWPDMGQSRPDACVVMILP